jgi:aspartyl-tRNA(Asn)/glutamyl-tRNA(Gln) amidotransferase subunit C
MDRARVEHVAKLAALSLSGEEAEAFARELEAIVKYVEQLHALDTNDVPATTSMELGRAAWRADETAKGLSHEDALREAPKVEHEGFAVPAFVEQ